MDLIARPILLCLLAAVLSPGHSAHAETVRVPGTGVRLAPPAGFSPAEKFAGYQDPERGASIVITEIPGPVSEVRRGMTARGLASRGMTLIESQTVALDGDEALLLHVSQRAGGVDFLKWMLVGGSAERTVMIVGTFPRDDSDLSDPIRASLLSASWRATKRADLFEGLTFHVEASPKMRLAERMGNLLILSETGSIAPGNPSLAILVIGNSLSDVDVGDLKSYSKERLAQTDRLRAVRVRGDSAVVIDGLTGCELIAEGTDSRTGRAVGVYQLLLIEGRSYYIAQGFVARARLKELLPVFRRVTGSFRRTVGTARPQITQ